MTFDKFKDLFINLSISDRLKIYNEYCMNYAGDDDCIYELDEEFFEAMFSDKMEVCRATVYGDVDFSCGYIRLNAYGNLESIMESEALDEIESVLEEIYVHEDIWAYYIG